MGHATIHCLRRHEWVGWFELQNAPSLMIARLILRTQLEEVLQQWLAPMSIDLQ